MPKDDCETRTGEDGQIELTVANTPLSEASDKLVKTKSQLGHAQLALETADEEWCEAMKEANLTKINHKGDIIQLVTGRTSKDHSRFSKS